MTPLLVLAALLLQPVLDAPGTLRVAAVGTGDEEVEWMVDGTFVGSTADGQAVVLNLSAGRHDLWAVSGTGGRWEAMARLEPDVPEGAAFVPAWHAVHEAEGNPDGLPDRLPTLALLALGGALAVWPRRSKSP